MILGDSGPAGLQQFEEVPEGTANVARIRHLLIRFDMEKMKNSLSMPLESCSHMRFMSTSSLPLLEDKTRWSNRFFRLRVTGRYSPPQCLKLLERNVFSSQRLVFILSSSSELSPLSSPSSSSRTLLLLPVGSGGNWDCVCCIGCICCVCMGCICRMVGIICICGMTIWGMY